MAANIPPSLPDESREAVQDFANAVAGRTRGGGPHIGLYCSAILSLCGLSSNIKGSTFTPSWIGDATIELCPSALSLRQAPASCSMPAVGSQVGASTSHVLFHSIPTWNNAVERVISNNVYGSLGNRGLLQASEAGETTIVPLQNEDSPAQRAIDE